MIVYCDGRGLNCFNLSERDEDHTHSCLDMTDSQTQQEAIDNLTRRELSINPRQHCTSEECSYTHSHTAKWCGYSQPRRCGCGFDYPEEN